MLFLGEQINQKSQVRAVIALTLSEYSGVHVYVGPSLRFKRTEILVADTATVAMPQFTQRELGTMDGDRALRGIDAEGMKISHTKNQVRHTRRTSTAAQKWISPDTLRIR